jgi:Mce-associated membrane protein
VLLIVGSVSGLKIGGLHIDKVSERSDARDWDAGTTAASAASRAMTAVLAYDYRHLEADRDRAVRFFTPDGRKDYLKNFNLLIKGKDGQVGPAVKTKTVVTADVLQTAVSDASKSRVRVVVFVNQTAVKGEKGTPAVFQNRVVVTMLHRGGDWLVDKIDTY